MSLHYFDFKLRASIHVRGPFFMPGNYCIQIKKYSKIYQRIANNKNYCIFVEN